MATLNEVKYATLVTLTSLTGKTIRELERTWLLTATGEPTGSLSFLNHTFLTQKGFTTGTLGERWFAYLGSLAYTGTLSERLHQFWDAGGPPP